MTSISANIEDRIYAAIEEYYGTFLEPVSYSVLNRQWHSRARRSGSLLSAYLDNLVNRGLVIAITSINGAKYFYPARCWNSLSESERLEAPMRVYMLARERAQLSKARVIPLNSARRKRASTDKGPHSA